MKTHAELAEALSNAVDKWFSPTHGGDIKIATVMAALDAWRSAPPDPPEIKITPGPMILSPPDKLSEEEVWMRAVESCLRSQTLATHRVVFEADGIVNAFRERFRGQVK